jgi:FkbM family methyltransferase
MRSRKPHRIFAEFERGTGDVRNWLGVRTRRDFFTPDLNFVRLTPPTPDDSEYFEWIDLLETVVAAGDEYTMIELGAGYGRWTVNAAAAVRAYGRSRYRLLAVEAEPTHFEWLRAHCADNDVGTSPSEGSLELVQAAVTDAGGTVEFAVGNPAGWYGQAIADGTWSPETVAEVPGVRLSELVDRLGTVDLIHADIQGAEADVMAEAIDALDARVARLHIGTHGAAVERELRSLLGGRGWIDVRDYPANRASKTPWGRMEFQDGVQTWTNPRTPTVRSAGS